MSNAARINNELQHQIARTLPGYHPFKPNQLTHKADLVDRYLAERFGAEYTDRPGHFVLPDGNTPNRSSLGSILADDFDMAMRIAQDIAAEVADRDQTERDEAAEEKRSPAAKRLARIGEAIRNGLGMTDRGERADSEAYAAAKVAAEGEAEFEKLNAAGERARQKEADALRKRKAEAEKAVAANPPTFDSEAADQAVADAKAAIGRLRSISGDYASQIEAARQTLLEGGFELHTGTFGVPEGTVAAGHYVRIGDDGPFHNAAEAAAGSFAAIRDAAR
ncbi:hypothetical protein ACIGKR_23925 [Rhodococcus qingshengii]|uniref:hypothetical protein n=1 Tax=Rhodococcus qingshengii TaxID=334542 RepID=UPI0037C6FE23